MQAPRDGQKLDIGYVSLTSPDEESWIIIPHTLVCTSLCWHVFAYCEKNRDFRYFVLGRFRDINGIDDHAEMTKNQDDRWNGMVDIALVTDSRLSDYQKAILDDDYYMVAELSLIPYAG